MADNDAVFQDAVEALRAGNKSKARELLTGLLKNDQNNATYWVWMSATVDTPKERIYCLQTALKLDPENVAAKRGLILHGALPPDDTVQPFPVNRPRAWEEKLLLAHEKPRLKGWAALRASPVARLGGFALLGAILVGVVVFGFLQVSASRNARPATATPGPSPTFTLTPTSINATGQPLVIGTAAPLSELLPVPYTVTPLYVSMKGSPLSADTYRLVKAAYEKGDWDEAIRRLQEVIRLDPQAEAYYHLGEAYRFKGDYNSALQSFESALSANPAFGPAYLGVARARLMANPNANVMSFLDEAIRLEPNFGESYLDRAVLKLRENNIAGALQDLAEADRRMPGSPLVYFELAQARIPLKAISVAATDGGSLPVNLLPSAQRQQSSLSATAALLLKALLVAVVGLNMTALGLTASNLNSAIARADQALQSITAEQQALRRKVGEAQANAAQIRQPRLRKLGSTPAVAIWEEVTRVLPSSTMLSELRVEGTTVQLDGQSANASELVGLLAASPMFTNVAFASPVTRDAQRGGERFQIKLQVGRADAAERTPSAGAAK